MKSEFSFYTGTASVCVFDLESLKHRLHDPPDWWADYFLEVEELNVGNAIFAALGSDGQFTVRVSDEDSYDFFGKHVSVKLRCPSGAIYIGPGEDVTGGELEPTIRRTTGRVFHLPKGNYEVLLQFDGCSQIGVKFTVIATNAINDFSNPISLI